MSIRPLLTLLLVSGLLVTSAQKPQLLLPIGPGAYPADVTYSPDGRFLLTRSQEQYRLWDTAGRLLRIFEPSLKVLFRPDSTGLLLASRKSLELRDLRTDTLQMHLSFLSDPVFRGSDTLFGRTTGDSLVSVDLKTSKKVFLTKAQRFLLSADRNTVLAFQETPGKQTNATVFQLQTGITLELSGFSAAPNGHVSGPTVLLLSNDGKWLAMETKMYKGSQQSYTSEGGHSSVQVWNLVTGQPTTSLPTFSLYVNLLCLSPDGRLLATAEEDRIRLWQTSTGKALYSIRHKGSAKAITFSPDGALLLAVGEDHRVHQYAIEEGGAERLAIAAHRGQILNLQWNKDGSVLATASADGTVGQWTSAGAPLKPLQSRCRPVQLVFQSPDGAYFGVVDSIALVDQFWLSGRVQVWNAFTMQRVRIDQRFTSIRFPQNVFSGSGMDRYFLSGKTVEGWPIQWSGPIGRQLPFHSGSLSVGRDQPTVNIWLNGRGFSMVLLDSTDFLVFDNAGRFDGSQKARDLLYITVGAEVLGLEQLKEKLWVPGLAERIFRGEAIGAASLDDLDLAGQLPWTELVEEAKAYQLRATPRRGGLGETVLFLNGVAILRYKPDQMKRQGAAYTIQVPKSDLAPFLVTGQPNTLVLKAYTLNKELSTRGVEVDVVSTATASSATAPNLYAVMIGVNQYKGPELKLSYAAEDARSLGVVIEHSAKKLLGNDHVFFYHLNTGSERDGFPEKKTIQTTFEEIGKKAKPNDILLVFFAGHGFVEPESKQFYLITAEATRSSLTANGLTGVGISTRELTEWMQPQRIRAQKRVLILDACHSGGAINEIVRIGKESEGYQAARSLSELETMRQIERLNDQAGLYILSASASTQSAYELGRYRQGLLTYALLKAMKEHPEVLDEGRYLNLSLWFQKAAGLVAELVRANGLRQEPQIVSANTFPLGMVDAGVRASINLPSANALFAAAVLLNSASSDDDLDVSRAVNRQLEIKARSGNGNQVSWQPQSDEPDAYSIRGSYSVENGIVTIKALLKKGKETIGTLEIKGPAAEPDHLAQSVVTAAMEKVFR